MGLPTPSLARKAVWGVRKEGIMPKMIPVKEFDWGEIGPLHKLTCRNHPTAEYLTKNPWARGLHLIKTPDGFPTLEECPCPFEDLVVVVEE